MSESGKNIHASVFIADTARVIGNVTIGEASSVWFGAVLRADPDPIVIGVGTSIQDNVVIHVDSDAPATIGSRVTVGHGAIIHGATIEDDVLIGIGAIVLNGARIGNHSIIAAGAVVTEGTEIPPRSMVMGIPGKVVRAINEADVAHIQRAAKNYVERSKKYLKGEYR